MAPSAGLGGGLALPGGPGLEHSPRHRGRVYTPVSPGETPEARLDRLIGRPRLLNELETDLSLVGYDRETRVWRFIGDAFGQNPIFYALKPEGLYWAFSLRELFSLLKEKPRPAEETLFDYLATHYRYVFRDPGRTFFDGPRMVPPGCFLTLSAQDGLTLAPWLDLSLDIPASRLDPDQATARFMELLAENVRLRLAGSSEETCFTVSSGLDSATVASLAGRELGSIKAVSVGYDGPGAEEYDETRGLAELMRHRDWTWRHLTLAPPENLVDLVGAHIQACSSPILTVTGLAQYLMARALAGDGVERVFTGIGGDECLAGEYEAFFYFFADLKRSGQEERLLEETAAWERLHDHPVFQKNPQVLAEYWRRNLNFETGGIRVDERRYRGNWEYFEPDWLRAAEPRPEPPMPTPYPTFLANRIYQELRYETTPPTIWSFNAAYGPFGLRGAHPFLSRRLVRLGLSLPGAVKYDRGLTKALLRRGLKGLLPEAIRLNPQKVGFNAPLDQWLRRDTIARDVLAVIRDGPLVTGKRLKKDSPERLLAEHRGGQNHMMLIWSLLNASIFLENL